MKKNIIIKNIMMACLCLSAASPTILQADTYAWQNLTQSDAIHAVQSFEQQPALSVSIISSPSSIPSSPDPQMGTYYTLGAGNFVYTVSLFSKDQIIREDPTFLSNRAAFYGGTYNPDSLRLQEMSQASAQNIAQAFLMSHFPSPQNLTLLHVQSDETNYSSQSPPFIQDYYFTFEQALPDGVGGPSRCTITVDTIKGEVVHYFAANFPVLIGTTPALTPAQAASYAATALNMPDPVLNDSVVLKGVSKPDSSGSEHLVYMLDMTGTGMVTGDPTHNVQFPAEYWVWVDANTGTMYDYSTLSGMSNKTKHSIKIRARRKGTRQPQAHGPSQKTGRSK